MSIIKQIIHSIVHPLVHICNTSFTNGEFPNSMKTAKIIPLFKAGDRYEFSNCRPVSVFPQFSKILEKVDKKRLVDFIESNKILCDSQFGFRSNHSTSLALYINDLCSTSKVFIRKVSRRMGILYVVKNILNQKSLFTLYCSLVFPYLNCACENWRNTYVSRIQPSIILQRK